MPKIEDFDANRKFYRYIGTSKQLSIRIDFLVTEVMEIQVTRCWVDNKLTEFGQICANHAPLIRELELFQMLMLFNCKAAAHGHIRIALRMYQGLIVKHCPV